MSYATPDLTLLSVSDYPYFYCSTPSMRSFNVAIIRFFQYLKWKRITLLYDYVETFHLQVFHFYAYIKDHSFRTYVKFPVKLTFLTP